MGIMITRNTRYAVTEEVTEGTIVLPTVGTDFFQTLADGAELNPARELLERNVYSGLIGNPTPKTTIRSGSGAIPVEWRANTTEGAAPEYDLLIHSGLGTKKTTTSSTSKTGHTATVIQIEDADISKYAVNDIVVIKEAGGFHISPISAVDTTLAAANITLKIPMAGAPADNVVVAPVTQYTVANSGHKSLSVHKYLEDARRESLSGAKVSSIALANFTTGQIPEMTFSLESLSYNQALQAIPATPVFDAVSPACALGAGFYIDATETQVNEFAVTVENTLGFVTSVTDASGRINSRVTERTVTGNFLPYKQDNSLTFYNLFDNRTEFSIFAYTANPTATAGEFENYSAVYLPQCIITELPEADQDGNIQSSISYTASTGESGDQNEIYIAYS